MTVTAKPSIDTLRDAMLAAKRVWFAAYSKLPEYARYEQARERHQLACRTINPQPGQFDDVDERLIHAERMLGYASRRLPEHRPYLAAWKAWNCARAMGNSHWMGL